MQSFVPDSDVIEGQSGFTLRVPKKFYCRETVSRAMYKFTGKYNLTMFPLEEGYVGVSFEGKDAQSQQDTLCIISDFKNELIDQQVRIDLDQRYGLLRDTIVQFAFEPEKKKELELTPSLLPFDFKKFPDDIFLIVNQGGDFLFLPLEEFSQLFSGSFVNNPSLLSELKSKHFYSDTDVELTLEMVATKLRSRKAFLRDFTALHMVVLTGYCNCNCDYCHASSEELSSLSNENMSCSTGEKVVDMIFKTRSPSIKIEFQGGEPLVNWKTLTHIVEYAEKINQEFEKDLSFVICTNLTLMDEEKAQYCKEHKVFISSSLDGPKNLHDGHRKMRDGSSGYDQFIEKLALCRKIIGQDSCSALVTLTKDHLPRIKEVIDEYRKCGFNGVFLRSLNPYGLAKQRLDILGYPVEEFIDAYKKAFFYILELNLSGTFFVEHFASILLERILTPYSTGFVDLQSPAGAGINGVIYDFNGDVYPTDEARMLAKVGDKKFRLGSVLEDSYETIFYGSKLQNLIKHSCVEILPGCASCAYKPFCGSDPIRYYNESGDVMGHRPTSVFCKKYQEIIDFLFSFIFEANDDVMDVFWSWINHRPLEMFGK